MFEAAEIGHAVDKATFVAQEPKLRQALLEAQYELKRQAHGPVIILINGIEGAGKGDTIRLLNEWMDPRLIQVSSFDQPSDEELARPSYWRYWRKLPEKGRMGVFFGNWYSQMLQDRVHGRIKTLELDQAIDRAQRLERMLVDEGALILKFWFHLSKTKMQNRLKQLSQDPNCSWRLSPLDWQQSKTYDRFVEYGERIVRRSSRDYAPWHVVEGSDPYYRNLRVGQVLLKALRQMLGKQPAARPMQRQLVQDDCNAHGLLASLDLSLSLGKSRYQQELLHEQARLATLMRDKRMKKHGLVAVFEGNDAAGKGGAIRRVAAALDPRQYHIVPIAAPSEDERAQPYLWRFWRQIPARGQFTIFDRSWYGRVLVERVEGFCTVEDWQRAYGEINDFEEQLTDAGVIVVKFWLSIDQDMQLTRFQEREANPIKRFKITEEDWRNREKWPAYSLAIEDMISRTSTEIAPWTLVEANDKRYARVKVLRTLNEAIERAFKRA